MGKVIDYVVKWKHCASCNHWEKQDHTTDAYKKWKDTRSAVCDVNFSGNAGAMEPQATRFSNHLNTTYDLGTSFPMAIRRRILYL